MPATLGLLLALPPEDPRTPRALAFLEAQLQAEPCQTLYLYCLADGVTTLQDLRTQRLRDEGVRVLACARSSLERGIQPGGQATFGGLGLLADLLASADRFLAAGPGSPAQWTPSRTLACSSPAPGDREVVIALQTPSPSPKHIAETVCVAAGLCANAPLRITLAVGPSALPLWAELQRTAVDPLLAEHLQLFLDSGGLVILPADSVPALDRQVQVPVKQHQTLSPSNWEARLAQAFTVIPF